MRKPHNERCLLARGGIAAALLYTYIPKFKNNITYIHVYAATITLKADVIHIAIFYRKSVSGIRKIPSN